MAFTATSESPPSGALTKSKQLWLTRAVSVDDQPTVPRILIKPSSPNANLYKRGNLNRSRCKSGDGRQTGEKESEIPSSVITTKSFDDERRNREHGTLREEDINGNANGELTVNVDTVTAPGLPSPTKRVTFMERCKLQNHSADGTFYAQPDNAPKRRVRKSKTLDAVDVSSSEKVMSPRSPVMGFFSQIRSVSNAPWRSSSTTSGIAPSTSPSSASSRPRSFTLGLKNFANFRQQPQQQEGRKSSRQQVRNVEVKDKRKRTRSYSFRAPSWLNLHKPKADQVLSRPHTTTLKPIIRRRSISANNLNLLGSKPISSEIGIARSENVFHDILSNYNCYDLMPQHGVVIGLDWKISGRQALNTLASNDVRIGLFWDFEGGEMVGILSASDFLRLLIDHKTDAMESEELQTESNANRVTCQCDGDILGQSIAKSLYNCPLAKKTRSVISVGSEASLRTALSLLIANRYHRLPVINSKTGDVLYFLTKKAVLHFLMHHISKKPMPMKLRETFEQSQLGTWQDANQAGDQEQRIICAWVNETLSTAVHKLLQSGISALPVVDVDGRLQGALDKYDLVHFMAFSMAKDADYRNTTIEEFMRQRDQGTERLITCPVETSVNAAIDMLIQNCGRRIYVVDGDEKIQAVITISDILSHLIAK